MTNGATRTNKYEGLCRRCRGIVPAGTGRLIDTSGGGRKRSVKPQDRWQVEHLDDTACDAESVAHEVAVADHKARLNTYDNAKRVWQNKRVHGLKLGVDMDDYAGPEPRPEDYDY